MKTTKFLTTILAVMFMILVVSACGKNEYDTTQSNNSGNNNEGVTLNNKLSEEALAICGSWAYIHDKETAIAVFGEDGRAEYEGKDYSFECDSQFIKLKDSEGNTIQLRYVLDDEGMYLYSNNTYTFCGDGEPDGVIGEWSCAEKNWSFSFTEAGTFMEDGYFPGYYTVDDANSTFKLVYNDHFEDTVCYFRIEDNKMQIEYPWRVVKISDI